MENTGKRYFIVRSNYSNGRVFTETPIETEGGKYLNRTELRRYLIETTNKNLSKQGIVLKDSDLHITSIEELSEDDYNTWLE